MTGTTPVEPTPDNTRVIVQRGVAQVVDVAVTSAVVYPITIALPLQTQFKLLVLFALVYFTYSAGLEGLWNGQTIGKRVVGIRVVSEFGERASLLQTAGRNVPGILPVGGIGAVIVALVSMAQTEQRQRVFDAVAATYVVEQ